MTNSNTCPLCSDAFETETNLRVHLEVEHRKSELAVYVVEDHDSRSDPVTGHDVQAPTP